MKLPFVPGLVAFAVFARIGYCFARDGSYGAGIVCGLLAIWLLSLRVTLYEREGLRHGFYWCSPRVRWCWPLYDAIRRDLSYTAEYRMGPDAWEQNGNNWRERRRFRAWIDAG